MRKVWLVFVLGGGLFVVDQILKNWAYRNLRAKPNFFIFGDFFSLEFYQNRGIAFGISLLPAVFYFLAFLIFSFLIAAGLRFWRQKKFFALCGIFLITLGAASNLIDRLRFGYVIDYFNLFFWPVFNLADLMIFAGAVILAAQSVTCPPLASPAGDGRRERKA